MTDTQCRIARLACNYLQEEEHWTQGQYTNLMDDKLEDEWAIVGEELAYAVMEPDCRVCMIGALIYACKQLDQPIFDRTRPVATTYLQIRQWLNSYVQRITGMTAAEFNDRPTASYEEVAFMMRGFAGEVCDARPSNE